MKDACDFQEILNQNPKFKSQIENLEESLTKEFNNNNLTEHDFNTIIKGISGKSQDYLTDASDGQFVKRLVEQYNSHVALIGESKLVTQIICRSLDSIYRSIYFQPHLGAYELKTEDNRLL
jgi:hypothetical protein